MSCVFIFACKNSLSECKSSFLHIFPKFRSQYLYLELAHLILEYSGLKGDSFIAFHILKQTAMEKIDEFIDYSAGNQEELRQIAKAFDRFTV